MMRRLRTLLSVVVILAAIALSIALSSGPYVPPQKIAPALHTTSVARPDGAIHPPVET